jgi:hypothetical protein
VACPLKAEIGYQKRLPLIGYGIIDCDATKEYVTPRKVTNGSKARNDVF